LIHKKARDCLSSLKTFTKMPDFSLSPCMYGFDPGRTGKRNGKVVFAQIVTYRHLLGFCTVQYSMCVRGGVAATLSPSPSYIPAKTTLQRSLTSTSIVAVWTVEYADEIFNGFLQRKTRVLNVPGID
jgi:hypothetical protein